MPVSRERIEKYQSRHLRQIEHAAKQVEGRESKTKNDNMRRVWLQSRDKMTLTTETNMIGCFTISRVKKSLLKP